MQKDRDSYLFVVSLSHWKIEDGLGDISQLPYPRSTWELEERLLWLWEPVTHMFSFFKPTQWPLHLSPWGPGTVTWSQSRSFFLFFWKDIGWHWDQSSNLSERLLFVISVTSNLHGPIPGFSLLGDQGFGQVGSTPPYTSFTPPPGCFHPCLHSFTGETAFISAILLSFLLNLYVLSEMSLLFFMYLLSERNFIQISCL